jgi:chromosome partitioning protein
LAVAIQSAAAAVRLIKQAMEVRLSPPQAVMFLSRAVKETKLKAKATALPDVMRYNRID